MSRAVGSPRGPEIPSGSGWGVRSRGSNALIISASANHVHYIQTTTVNNFEPEWFC